MSQHVSGDNRKSAEVMNYFLKNIFEYFEENGKGYWRGKKLHDIDSNQNIKW